MENNENKKNFKKKEKSIIFLDKEEQVKIMGLYKLTKGNNKYKDFNDLVELHIKKNKFALIIAKRNIYKKAKNQSQLEKFLGMYRHNNREQEHKTDLMKITEIDSSNNIYKDYIPKKDIIERIKNIENNNEYKNTDQMFKELYDKARNAKKRLKRAEKNNNKEKIESIKKELENIENARKDLKNETKKNKKPKKGADLIKEAVIIVKENTTPEQIINSFNKVYEKIPFLKNAEIINISIHKDEGKINSLTNELEFNHHAHILFDNIDKKTKKTIFRNLKKSHLSIMQDVISKELGIQRGERYKRVKGDTINKDDRKKITRHKSKWQLQKESQEAIKKLKNKEYINQIEKMIQQDKERDESFVINYKPIDTAYTAKTEAEINAEFNYILKNQPPIFDTTNLIELTRPFDSTECSIKWLDYTQNLTTTQELSAELTTQNTQNTKFFQQNQEQNKQEFIQPTEFHATEANTEYNYTENYYDEFDNVDFTTATYTQHTQHVPPQMQELTQDFIQPNQPNHAPTQEFNAKLTNTNTQPKAETKPQTPPQATIQPKTIQPTQTATPKQTPQTTKETTPAKPPKPELVAFKDDRQALLDSSKPYTEQDTELQNLAKQIQSLLDRVPNDENDTKEILEIAIREKNNKNLAEYDKNEYNSLYKKLQDAENSNNKFAIQNLCRDYITWYVKPRILPEINKKIEAFNNRKDKVIENIRINQQKVTLNQKTFEINTNIAPKQENQFKAELDSKKSKLQESTIKKPTPKPKPQDKSHGFSR